MSRRIEIVLKPEQAKLQDTINEKFRDVRHLPDRNTGTDIILSVPATSDVAFLDALGVQYKEIGPPGRPRIYSSRTRSSLEMSPEVWEGVDMARGNESRAVFIEQAVRKALGMPALELLQ